MFLSSSIFKELCPQQSFVKFRAFYSPALQDRIPLVDDAEDAVVLMDVDADIKRPVFACCVV